MRNLEYKARIDDLDAAAEKALALGARHEADLQQVDTYFRVAKGRLKLREIDGLLGELIFYQRDEESVDRPSDYEVFRTGEPVQLGVLLVGALEVIAVVRKHRRILVLDGTRVHLDNVQGVGSFLELEVPVLEADKQAAERLNAQMADLGLTWEQGIRASYLDLTKET